MDRSAKLASRMQRLGTETAFEVLARARALEARGVDVIHLEIGEPDFDTPRHIVDAAVDALRQGYTHYGPANGLPALREAIAEEIARTRGISVSPDEVVVTPGAKPIIFYTMLALVDDGDEVIYPNPGFPIYESMIEYAGGKAVPLPLREERGFAFDADEFRALVTSRTKLVVLNSPGNPTGGILSKADLETVAEVARDRDLMILSDEIYSRILYEGEHLSIASLPGMQERTIILDGFSKTYAMTGWRLGYGVMPTWLAAQVSRLMVNSNSCTATFSQLAGIAALRGPQAPAEAMVAEFRRRRDVIVEGLNRIPGIRCVRPKGAFYAFPNVSGTGLDCRQFSDYLLNEYGVAALAGTAFGRYGEGYIRLSYANSIENIQKALNRIEEAVAALRVAR